MFSNRTIFSIEPCSFLLCSWIAYISDLNLHIPYLITILLCDFGTSIQRTNMFITTTCFDHICLIFIMFPHSTVGYNWLNETINIPRIPKLHIFIRTLHNTLYIVAITILGNQPFGFKYIWVNLITPLLGYWSINVLQHF